MFRRVASVENWVFLPALELKAEARWIFVRLMYCRWPVRVGKFSVDRWVFTCNTWKKIFTEIIVNIHLSRVPWKRKIYRGVEIFRTTDQFWKINYIIKFVFFSDEVWFTFRGTANSQNESFVNPHAFREDFFTRSYSAVSARKITGLMFRKKINYDHYAKLILTPIIRESPEE